jgi:hypothetical protein
MPIINVPSPWSAASDAIGGYVEQKDKYQALKEAKAQQDFLNQRSLNTEQFQAQKAALDQKTFDENHRMNEADLASRQLHDQIDKANQDYIVSQRPIAEAAAKAQLDGTLTANKKATWQLHGDMADDKYIRDRLGHGLSVEQAQAELAKNHAQMVEYYAQAARAYAATRNENARTAETHRHNVVDEGYRGKEMVLRATRAAGRGNATTAANNEYASDVGGLSPTAQQFYGNLYSTNNPPTRQQAILAVHAARARGGSNAMTAGDEQALTQLILNKNSQFVTPSQQATTQRAEQKAQAGPKPTTPVQTATAVRSAQGQLKTMFGIDPPSDDPHFDEVLAHFAGNPADRDHMLQDPKMPQSTKQYLMRIRNMIP